MFSHVAAFLLVLFSHKTTTHLSSPPPHPPISPYPTPLSPLPTTMIQTVNPYATSRTAQIMSRYRPIAPKPVASAADPDASAVPNGIRKSAYLTNVWAHLQARPTRTRKRGRSATFTPLYAKRDRTCLQGLSLPYPVSSPAKSLAMHGFTHARNGLSLVPNFTATAEPPPLLCCTAHHLVNGNAASVIDLNLTAEQPPEELELLPQIREPEKPRVISPRPVRPVGSNITVRSVYEDPLKEAAEQEAAEEEVEEGLEAEKVPAIVSDSNNKVRICNSAYREMVGQPECCWLECAGCGGGKRIGGEVSVQFVDSTMVQTSMAAFGCSVKIEWEREGKKMKVDASCSGVKIACERKDYQFMWRFYMN